MKKNLIRTNKDSPELLNYQAALLKKQAAIIGLIAVIIGFFSQLLKVWLPTLTSISPYLLVVIIIVQIISKQWIE